MEVTKNVAEWIEKEVSETIQEEKRCYSLKPNHKIDKHEHYIRAIIKYLSTL